MRSMSASSDRLRVLLLSPKDSSARQALVQGNVSWILVPAAETWLCWQPGWLVLRGRGWG